MPTKTIFIAGFTITYDMDNPSAATIINGDLKQPCPNCGSPSCYEDCDQSVSDQSLETAQNFIDRCKWSGFVDGVESLLLALHCAGFDLSIPEVEKVVETALASGERNFLGQNTKGQNKYARKR